MKTYIEVLAGKTKRDVKPVLITDDAEIIAAFAQVLAERFGVQLADQVRMHLAESEREEG